MSINRKWNIQVAGENVMYPQQIPRKVSDLVAYELQLLSRVKIKKQIPVSSLRDKKFSAKILYSSADVECFYSVWRYITVVGLLKKLNGLQLGRMYRWNFQGKKGRWGRIQAHGIHQEIHGEETGGTIQKRGNATRQNVD